MTECPSCLHPIHRGGECPVDGFDSDGDEHLCPCDYNSIVFTLMRNGVILHWPSPGENIGAWVTVNDTTGEKNYYAAWEDDIFVEITKEQFNVLAQRMGIPEQP